MNPGLLFLIHLKKLVSLSSHHNEGSVNKNGFEGNPSYVNRKVHVQKGLVTAVRVKKNLELYT